METYTLPIHFGNLQGKHEISSDSLLIFVESYKEISEIFGLNVGVQIGIPSEGGWKSKLTISAIVVGALNFIGIDNLSILLTGKESKEWFYSANNRLKLIGEFITTEAVNLSDEFPKECIRQKNKMYQQFQKDGCVDSFRMGDFPAIPKNNFELYIKEVPNEEYEYLGETNITVHSPDWKGTRSWRGNIEMLDDKVSTFAFYRDFTGKFWEKVELDSLSLHTTDIMRVQLIRRPMHKVKYLVARVLTYNDEIIDLPINADDISKIAALNTSLIPKKTWLGTQHSLF
jgi:hypothetical protein